MQASERHCLEASGSQATGAKELKKGLTVLCADKARKRIQHTHVPMSVANMRRAALFRPGVRTSTINYVLQASFTV